MDQPTSSDPLVIKDGEEYIIYQDKVIGRGAFSEVYKGRTKAGKSVAIKSATKRVEIEAMLNEIEVLKSLKNVPNIVQYVGSVYQKSNRKASNSGVLSEMATFAMEFAIGSLEHFMREAQYYKGLSANMLCDLVIDCASALSALKNLNIAHRDIKHMNILIFPGTPTNGRRSDHIFKLCDLGCAKSLLTDDLKTRNEMNTLVGTPNMLHPNLAQELCGPHDWHTQNPYTADQCDLWSLGCTLYFCSTGSFPFSNDNSDRQLYYQSTLALKQNEDAIGMKFKGKFHNQMLRKTQYEYEPITELPTNASNRLPKWLVHTLTGLIRLFFHDPSIDKYAEIANYLKVAPRKRLLSIDKLSVIEQCDMSKCPFIGFNSPTLSECLGYPSDIRLCFISHTTIKYTEPKQKDFKNLKNENDTYLVIPECAATELRKIRFQNLEYNEASNLPETKLIETRKKKIVDGLSFLREAEEILELFELISKILTTQYSLLIEEIQNDERIPITSRFAVYLETATIPVALFSQNMGEQQEIFTDCLEKARENIKELDNHMKTSLKLIKCGKEWRETSRKLNLTQLDVPGIKEEISEFFIFDKKEIIGTSEYSQSLVEMCLNKRTHLLKQLFDEPVNIQGSNNKLELAMQCAQYLRSLRNEHSKLQKIINECVDVLEIPHQEMKKITHEQLSKLEIDRNAVRRSIRYQSPKYQEAQKKIKPAFTRIQKLTKDLEHELKDLGFERMGDTLLQQNTSSSSSASTSSSSSSASSSEPPSELPTVPEQSSISKNESENVISPSEQLSHVPLPLDNPNFFSALISRMSRRSEEL